MIFLGQNSFINLVTVFGHYHQNRERKQTLPHPLPPSCPSTTSISLLTNGKKQQQQQQHLGMSKHSYPKSRTKQPRLTDRKEKH